MTPLVEEVQFFDLRDKLFTTGIVEDVKKPQAGSKPGVLNVQSKEGLNLGLAITVRYQLDPRRLDYVQSHLPQPVDTEIVPPVVASAWRELGTKLHRPRDLQLTTRGSSCNAPLRSSRGS